MEKTYIHSSLTKEDQKFEIPLRPNSLQDFVGQQEAISRLQILIEAAKERKDPLGHVLFLGPPGLGKTTLANILAKSMGCSIFSTTGPILEKAGDLAGILTNVKQNDIVFIDEIHRLSPIVEEYLYSAMEDYRLDLIIDAGPNARTVPIEITPFTLVGATTKAGSLSSPLRSRFPNLIRLNYYSQEALGNILIRSASLMNIDLSYECAQEIAKRARGTPRIANNLLRWVRDYSQIKCNNKIDPYIVQDALLMLAIDKNGLDEMDKKILDVIITQHSGGPVGIKTISVAVGEDASTIEDMYEPFLIMQGLIKRTPRGREATKRAYSYLGLQCPKKYLGDLT